MKGMNFENLGKLVQDDAKQRYNLISEPSTDESAEDVWWIRANQGHSLQVKMYFVLLLSTCSYKRLSEGRRLAA